MVRGELSGIYLGIEFYPCLQNNSLSWHCWFIWREIFGMKVPGSCVFGVLRKKVSEWSSLVEQNVNNAAYYPHNRLINCLECQKRLTRSTLLPEWSCTWHKTSRCQGRIRWWLWGRCSWRCSSCCHTGATAARWSWMRTGSGGTRRWWRCSRSQHTGLWWWLCSPHLWSNRVMSAEEQTDDFTLWTQAKVSCGVFRYTALSLQWATCIIYSAKNSILSKLFSTCPQMCSF